jgi:hypothetical protein
VDKFKGTAKPLEADIGAHFDALGTRVRVAF